MALAQPSVKSYLGIAKETTKGTAVTATNFIPFNMTTFKPVDVIDPLYDTGLRGSMVENYAYLQGRKHSTVDVGGSVFADTIGYWMTGLMGEVATTGSTAPYTHAISLKNAVGGSGDAQPISYTLTDFYSANTRQYPGFQVTDLGLTFNADGLLEYTVKGMGFPSATTSAPAPSFSTVLPTQVWTGTVSIGGSTVAYTRTASLDVVRKAEAIFGIANTQSPYQIFVASLTAKGKATFVMQDDTELTRYLTNTQPALTFNFSTGSGATAAQVAFTISKGAYTTAAIERNADYVEITVDIEGIGNTTDVGASSGYAPVKFTLQNALPSGTYA